MPRWFSGRHFILIAAKLVESRDANRYSVSGMRILVSYGHQFEICVLLIELSHNCQRDSRQAHFHVYRPCYCSSMGVVISWIWTPEKQVKLGRVAGFTITEINIQFLESSLIENNRIEQEIRNIFKTQRHKKSQFQFWQIWHLFSPVISSSSL